MTITTSDKGYDMQPEFDKHTSKSATVNYTKIKSAGEVQDDLRAAEETPKLT